MPRMPKSNSDKLHHIIDQLASDVVPDKVKDAGKYIKNLAKKAHKLVAAIQPAAPAAA